jgi:hypothetical protein
VQAFIYVYQRDLLTTARYTVPMRIELACTAVTTQYDELGAQVLVGLMSLSTLSRMCRQVYALSGRCATTYSQPLLLQHRGSFLDSERAGSSTNLPYYPEVRLCRHNRSLLKDPQTMCCMTVLWRPDLRGGWRRVRAATKRQTSGSRRITGTAAMCCAVDLRRPLESSRCVCSPVFGFESARSAC